MATTVQVIDKENDHIYRINIRPLAFPRRLDRLSLIIEISQLSTGKRQEVWHLQILHETGEITHRHRKYPAETK